MLRVEDLCPGLMHFCFHGGGKGAGGQVAIRGKDMRRALHLLLLTAEERDDAWALRSVCKFMSVFSQISCSGSQPRG